MTYSLSFQVWLHRRYRSPINWRREMRRVMRNNVDQANAKGRGNKAWKRADRVERQWRRSGGFTLADLIP